MVMHAYVLLQAPGGWIQVPFWLVSLVVGLLITAGIVYLVDQTWGNQS